MTLISFEDAVTAGNLNPNQSHAVFYIDGVFANRDAVARRCPKAKLYGITVFGRLGRDVFACDCERGDMTVAQTVAWVAAQVRLNVPLVCVYAGLDTWENQGLLKALEKYGHRIRRWVAHYNNIPEVPPWADADQFASPGPIDRDVAVANFFNGVSPVVPPPKPHGHVRFEGTFDLASGKVLSVRGLPGLGVRFAGPEKWLDVQVQIQAGKGGGAWRARP